ncbi:hypothetical protein FHR84_003271 [Actinopolyspora biskrensis]|uniref:Peptidase inhibitor family I36 n=1 Tax=Actinopolyspora biskrensis TaxID=1470178 RepID=A0A852Z1P1_9ACTN|nr:hypothetical protein [Actinopolyspora biskrensis]NYH79922.1 hypothetical protein [Actinopolyspora biskrensis]
MRNIRRVLAGAAAVVAMTAGTAAATAAGNHAQKGEDIGPIAFQTDSTTRKCPPKKYCFFYSKNFNNEASGGWPRQQAWAYDKAWKHFHYDPVTSGPYRPVATNAVKSVINNGTGKTVYFMEWNYGLPDGGTKVCLGVRSGQTVRDVVARTGGDGGYGSARLTKPDNCEIVYSGPNS